MHAVSCRFLGASRISVWIVSRTSTTCASEQRSISSTRNTTGQRERSMSHAKWPDTLSIGFFWLLSYTLAPFAESQRKNLLTAAAPPNRAASAVTYAMIWSGPMRTKRTIARAATSA